MVALDYRHSNADCSHRGFHRIAAPAMARAPLDQSPFSIALKKERLLSKSKKPKRYRTVRYGILNPYGDVWTPDTFDTPEQAELHVKDFWREQEMDLTKFKVVQVTVVVTAYMEERLWKE